MLPWLICGILALAVLALLGKLLLLRRDLGELSKQLGERLSQDTNNPIFLSTRDSHARALAAKLNVQLRELRRQQQRFEHGDRELKEAVTNVSHDLRTPLTAICGYLELLERGEKTPEQARYLAMICQRTEAMKTLTEELLRYSVAASRADQRNLEAVDLKAAVEEAIASFYAALTEGGITLDVKLPQERVVRRLDRAALARILGNLISNALKYSAGDLEVELSQEGTVILSNAAPGLDEVAVGRLFDRFYTVETGKGSTGLGLSIAKALTEGMGGAISARYGNGRLTVAVEFPQGI